jgi:hypothetical protein
MTETRDFPTEMIATLCSGVMVTDGGFSKVHEAAEFLMGHPIWTHHFADKKLWDEMQRTVLEQCPGMPTDLSGIDKTNWQAKRDELIKEFGATVKIRKGGGLTAMLPTDGIPDHLKDNVITVSVDR